MEHYQPFVSFKCDEVINKRGYDVSVRVRGWTAEAEAQNDEPEYGNTFWHDAEEKIIYCRLSTDLEVQVVAHGIKTKKAAVEWMNSVEGHKAMYAAVNAQREVKQAAFYESRKRIAAIKAAKQAAKAEPVEQVEEQAPKFKINDFELNQVVVIADNGKLGKVEMISHVEGKARYRVNAQWYAEEELKAAIDNTRVIDCTRPTPEQLEATRQHAMQTRKLNRAHEEANAINENVDHVAEKVSESIPRLLFKVKTNQIELSEALTNADFYAKWLERSGVAKHLPVWQLIEDAKKEIQSKQISTVLESSSLERELKELYHNVTTEGLSPIDACKRAVVILDQLTGMNGVNLQSVNQTFDYLVKAIRTRILFSAEESNRLLSTPVFDIPKPLQALAAEIATYSK